MIAELYRRVPHLLMARRNLSRTTIRSVLAALGIVIGVIAIASLGILGTTLQAAATQSLGSIGNEVIVNPAFQEGVETLTDRDVRDIRRATDAAVVPVKQDRVLVGFGQQEQVVTAYGMADPAAAYTARSGRVPEPFRNGVLVGSGLADRLEVRQGNTLRVDNRTYRVVAVLTEQTGFSPLNPNNAVVLPEDAVGGEGYDQVLVRTQTGQAANESAVAIKEALNRRETRVSTFEFASITASIGEFFGLLNAFLIAIGSISLVVAGVSILNVMLMSTIERRGEIGVLRAVGYQRADVLKILLAEAALLGVAGGLVGAVLSLLVGALLNQFALGDPLAVFRPASLVYLPVAFAFGVGTSVVSGLYPAWKAARENPVEALRD